ncbi:hypothetical protein M3172_03710 [Mesobacillus subterraneus]|uniref:hypothetical protein n=1 Tax=Mesobacillus subterraneus TaxID=285983 RepID=UPI00203AACE3|nr:hypothetical protein [Mesobacillus subterraneus]MCM3572283.1 hypothetical protein [Mesobacillus subterraneus]
MNTKAENFKRLAEKRVTECVKKIRLISNLSNKNNYEYTEEQTKKIIRALEIEILILKEKFNGDSGDQEFTFKLDD